MEAANDFSNNKNSNIDNRINRIRVLFIGKRLMDIEEIQEIELLDCDACGASGFLYEMEYCECGSLVHKGCINGNKCDACERSTLVTDYLDSLVA